MAIFQISHLKDGKYRTDFLATGVALTDKGVCATNYHVFKEIMSDSISNNILYFVMTAEGNVYPLQTLLAADGTNDFILFRIDTGKDKLVPLPLGKAAFEGEEIYCLSHPQGQLFYLTKGIVSRNQSLRVRSTGALKTEMQISADYAVGSSGGPVIDCRGNLVGLISTTTSLYPDRNSAMNFQMSIKSTVPVNLLLDCIVTSKKQ